MNTAVKAHFRKLTEVEDYDKKFYFIIIPTIGFIYKKHIDDYSLMAGIQWLIWQFNINIKW